MEERDRIEAAFASARQQIESLREEAHTLYLQTVDGEQTDTAEATAQMTAKHILVNEMCRVLTNLKTVAECRVYERNGASTEIELF